AAFCLKAASLRTSLNFSKRTPRFSLTSCLLLLKLAASSRARCRASDCRPATLEAARQRPSSSAAAKNLRICPSHLKIPFAVQTVNTADEIFVAEKRAVGGRRSVVEADAARAFIMDD